MVHGRPARLVGATTVAGTLSEVVLVTGATAGLGRGLAQELARSGATVLLHGRDRERGETALREIREATGNERRSLYLADLASLAQARRLADEVARDHPRLDVLVNNAGIGSTTGGVERRELSADGYELRFAVNYLAGALLARRLAPLIAGRIVNVSSAGQTAIDFDDVMLERGYDGIRAYCQSKLAQVMLTFDLAAELRDAGVAVNCLHPATYMPTKMVLESGARPVSSLEQGIEATRRLVELDGVTGRYFNGLHEARAHPRAYDADARRRLRELTAQWLDR